jgi:hypothetical protein
MYLCDSKIDARSAEIYSEIAKYYRATDACDNATAARPWKQFKEWCENGGYTREEINRAKSRVQSAGKGGE